MDTINTLYTRRDEKIEKAFQLKLLLAWEWIKTL